MLRDIFNPINITDRLNRKKFGWKRYIFLLLFLIVINCFISDYITERFNLKDYLKVIASELHPILFIAYTIFIFPIIEELIYRLGLVFKPSYIKIAVSVFLVDRLFSYEIFYLIIDFNFRFFIKICILGISLIVVYWLLNQKRIVCFCERFWEKHIVYIYYTSIVLFAVAHLAKFEVTNELIIFIPLILIPYLIVGVAFSYVRLRLGFLYAVLMHIFFNLGQVLIAVFFVYMISNDHVEDRNIDEETLKNQIENLYNENDSLQQVLNELQKNK